MTKLIVIALIVYAIAKAIRRRNERQEAERAEQERRRIREEQARQREAIKRQQELAREQQRRQAELAKQQAEIRAEQDRQRREQDRQAQEQERQRKEQVKQAEQLAALEHRVTLAESDIAADNERVAGLYALMDLAAARQAQAVPGSKEDEAEQRKIISLQRQIHTAEKRIAKAEYDRDSALRRLA